MPLVTVRHDGKIVFNGWVGIPRFNESKEYASVKDLVYHLCVLSRNSNKHHPDHEKAQEALRQVYERMSHMERHNNAPLRGGK